MFELDWDKKLEICCEQMSLDYNISEKTAHSIIVDMDLYDTVFEFYEEVLSQIEKEEEERLDREAELERSHYADGWADHEGV